MNISVWKKELFSLAEYQKADGSSLFLDLTSSLRSAAFRLPVQLPVRCHHVVLVEGNLVGAITTVHLRSQRSHGWRLSVLMRPPPCVARPGLDPECRQSPGSSLSPSRPQRGQFCFCRGHRRARPNSIEFASRKSLRISRLFFSPLKKAMFDYYHSCFLILGRKLSFRSGLSVLWFKGF